MLPEDNNEVCIQLKGTGMNRTILNLIFCLFISHPMLGQRGVNDTIPIGILIENGDTVLHTYLQPVEIVDQAPDWLKERRRQEKRQREAYQRLRYNVYVVYPYAAMAGIILRDVDSMLQVIQSKPAKREYKRRKEDELNRKFKGELQNMSTYQGQILVKLIARQTGRPCYSIIRDLKGGFNAGLFQAMAILFDNNLQNNYDPLGDDAAIEQVVQEIESRGHFERRQ
ncbi:MAG TPA: DUF4294 domain-containing protein [Chitinophagaceae bacterium]|nr:DUF4294 domain-containing protein [Chitinophagaceae bacterium]